MDEIKRKYRDINNRQKVHFNKNVKQYFKIEYSRIESDDGLKRLYGYQYNMLISLVNSHTTYISNQSHCLYGNYCFHKPNKVGRFEYDMILLENGEIYLYNITTDKLRKIHYKMIQNKTRKRKR